jgi:hypothetical protein
MRELLLFLLRPPGFDRNGKELLTLFLEHWNYKQEAPSPTWFC